MKRFLNTLLIGTLFFWFGCDTDPLTNAIDDFGVVIELEPINSYVGLGIYEVGTGIPISGTVSIEFEPEIANDIIDIFSDPIPTLSFDGGFTNFGISNELVPSFEDPVSIRMTISADGYLTETFNFSVLDTGFTGRNFQLISESNLPSLINQSSLTAPLDNNGNPLPLPFPGITTSNKQMARGFSLLSQNSSSYPWFGTISAHSNNEMTWFTDGWDTGGALPSEYELSTLSQINIGTNVSNGGHPCNAFVSSQFSNATEYGGDLYYSCYGNEESSSRLNEPLIRTIFSAGIQIKDKSGNSFENPVAIDIPSASGLDLLIAHQHTNSIDIDSITIGLKDEKLYGVVGTMTSHANGVRIGQGNPRILPVKLTQMAKTNFENQLQSNQRNGLSSSDSLALYVLYDDINNPDDEAKKIIVFQHSMTVGNNGASGSPSYLFEQAFYATDGATNGPLLAVMGELESVNVNFLVRNSRSYTEGMDVPTLTIEGYNYEVALPYAATGFDVGEPNSEMVRIGETTVPKSKGIFKWVDYTQEIDFTNFNGGEFVINIPPYEGQRIDHSVTANLNCSDQNKALRFTEIELSTLLYRKSGSTDLFSQLPITGNNWNYDENEKILRSATVNLLNVENGTQIEYFIKSGEFRFPESDNTYERITITGFEQTVDFTIDDEDFCTD